jgi:hypothetical protein
VLIIIVAIARLTTFNFLADLGSLHLLEESMTNSDTNFLFVFAHVLAKFQFIEEGIRIYLKAAYALTRAKLQGAITINLSAESLQNRSLSASMHRVTT